MVNFHLPLPDPLAAELRSLAGAQGRPATELARDYVRDGLARAKRAQREAEIRAYAEEWAGTEFDLDPALEAAGAEVILRDDP